MQDKEALLVKLGIKTSLIGAAAAIAVSAALLPTPANAAASAWSSCPEGHFCAWTGDNGGGSMCKWSGDDPDWTNGTIVCGWAAGTRVQSVFNNGTTGVPVSAYTATSYGGTKMFCLAKGSQLNLSGVGTYLRSHTWDC
ncbi:peptidase inhibitor family I36 protein [Streptomyces virginiae]|uniref:peptidase inhibitor family I36 protein n=1 Tax=Streptomyces virginiae TaxID=1961 RepID=UPI0035DBB9FC